MKKLLKSILAFTLCIIISLSLCSAAFAQSSEEITILFTHDLHSHLLPSRDEDGGTYGGYAKLMTVISQQKEKHPNAILVDGGDFSMGSLFQTAYATNAIELRMMGAMGYDATTFGNHEYDYLQEGLISMLNSAVASGERLPQIVEANYLPPEKGEEGYNPEMHAALEGYGVKDYILLERGGIHYAIFGIFGYDSDDCAPNSGMILYDPQEYAQKTVDAAVSECKIKYGTEPVVVCLSHSGTDDEKGEDYKLAKKVDGIDVIISGHTHTTLQKPIKVNDTYIVSGGEYGKYLGILKLQLNPNGSTTFSGYELIPVDENVADDALIAELVENYKTTVEEEYLSKYGLKFDDVLTNNPYEFDSVDAVYATQHESTLGNLFSDAYKAAVENVTGETVDVALTAAGVVRETLPKGDVTVSDVFNAASLGVGTEGELIKVYITGKELKNALEVDASVQPLMKSAQLFFSGVEYSFNTYRMIFNKVDYAMLRRNDGTLEEIDDDKLYSVVTGMYVGQMLGAVEQTSMGLISITPRDKDGNPIAVSDLKNHVVTDADGNPLKEWYAISCHLQNMGGSMDKKYAEPDGRKVAYKSLNPIKLLSNANIFTYVVFTLVNVLIVVIVFVVRHIIIRKRKKESEQE